MAEKNWLITLSGDRSINLVKKDIEAIGFHVHQTLKDIGCITGSANETVAKKVRQISGIADLSEDPGEFNIGPPNSPITW